jgi:hypothetical protein
MNRLAPEVEIHHGTTALTVTSSGPRSSLISATTPQEETAQVQTGMPLTLASSPTVN